MSVAEIAEAEKEIIRQVQAEAYESEIKMLKGRSGVPVVTKDKRKCNVVGKTSPLCKLDPFIDEDGIMKVGGRLRQTNNMQETQRHPAILPKQSHITHLIICHYHNRVSHQGRGMTLNEIRSCGYWIIGGSSLVSRHFSKCVICRKVRSETQGQKMADLPADRLELSPPFTYSAVDFFGPFINMECSLHAWSQEQYILKQQTAWIQALSSMHIVIL